MPVLESTDNKITPKSILRYRPIGESSDRTRTPAPASANSPKVARASRLRPPDTDDASEDREDIAEWQRGGTTISQTVPRPQRTPYTTEPQTRISKPWRMFPQLRLPKSPLSQHSSRRVHPLLYLGLGMCAMLVLWFVVSTVFGWFAILLDDLHYGRPRTFQTDARVGHNEQTGLPSHFIAINYNRHIEIIELPGGDATHAHIYVGPQLFGANDDLVAVTLRFVDVNGDHKPDMIVNFQGSHIVFLNDSDVFRIPRPAERQQIDQFLSQAGQ